MNGCRALRTFIEVSLIAGILACGSESPPITLASRAEVRIVSPGTTDDTIGAYLSTNLELEVHDSSGAPASARNITISSLRDTPSPYSSFAALFSRSTGAPGVVVLKDVTDANGKLAVTARLDERVGSGWITVDAGFLGRDSIRVVIRPGAPVRLDLAPRDTAVAVGFAYAPTVSVRDRVGNTLDNMPTLTSRRASVAATDGGLIRTSRPGRVYVVGTIGSATDSVALSVVPSGTLAAFRYRYSSGDLTTLATFNVDGSDYRRLVLPDYDLGSPRWVPQLNELVLHGWDSTFANSRGLFALGASNRPQLLYSPGPEADGAFPQPTRDGLWIHYAQRVGWGSVEVWRMRPDGTGREAVGPKAGEYDSYSQPTPSPDGRAIVYLSNDGGFNSGALRLVRLDLTTGGSMSLGAFGTHPRWSPVANEIAYLAPGAVRIVQADGTGDQALATNQLFDDYAQVDWSPDGKWLVVCGAYGHAGGRRLVLIERATGEQVPLPFSYRDNLCEATWTR